ncbi:MAG: eukaryotic-like serine/threonine-protein kinase [Blastocatellia bacterium]|jgi:serine/threonine-protein kinase|nr:eukaryotic-like serine/threonine-protein kinase [Blastocatellia bacterium]
MIGRVLLNYRVVEKLGEGGQGEIYRAVDTTLDRAVVIKVLPPQLTRHANLIRFEREAKLASSLDHPNICTIFGLYKVDDVHFIAMQLVEGRNVRQLVGGRPLELKSALSIAVQVTDALAAAHARGIIHRDIKAGNVMVTDAGIVKVLDFGLAKLLERGNDNTNDTNDPHVTELGVPYGTATYAAPEQAQGEQADHRTDIFSTGVLLYELLAGTWPFKGKTIVDVRYAVLHAEPVPLAEARQEDSPVLPRLQKIVDRALAKEPSERYQRIEDFRDDLRGVLRAIDTEGSSAGHTSAGLPYAPPRHMRDEAALWYGRPLRRKGWVFVVLTALLAAAALLAYSFLYQRSRRPAAIDSLAVMPFTNASADPNDEYLSDGITESLIDSLSQLPYLKVRSRNTVFYYKGREAEPRKVGRELGVRALLSGRVAQHGDELAVSVELIDAQDDSHIWGERYSRKLAELPALQEEISRDVSEELRLRLGGAEQKQMLRSYATNSEAYRLYLQGRFNWNKRTAEGLEKGIEYFNQAILKDLRYTPAYTGLADCYALLNVYNVAPALESYPKARAAAQKALELDEQLAEAHASLAFVAYRYYWDWPTAEAHFKRALELNPNYATAHQWYSAFLAAAGRNDEAVAEARRAQEIDPFSLTINADVAHHLYYARRYDEALAECRKMIEMDKNFARAHVEMGQVFAQKMMLAEAIAEFQLSLTLSEDSPVALAGLGHALALAGKRDEALKIVKRLDELAKQHYVSPYHTAVVYAGLGEKERALNLLEKARNERFNWMPFLQVEPLFDALRGEPKFNELAGSVDPAR